MQFISIKMLSYLNVVLCNSEKSDALVTLCIWIVVHVTDDEKALNFPFVMHSDEGLMRLECSDNKKWLEPLDCVVYVRGK
jgi:hypothetical protein